jgi:hypothetical protein
MQEDQGTTAEGAVGRRAALGRAAAVLAGVAGVGVVTGVLNGSPADAAAGDNLVLGQDNDAEATTTSLTSSADGGTLELSNSAAGAPLRVAVSESGISAQSVAGDVYSVDGAGDGSIALPVYTHITGTGEDDFPLASLVFTDFTAFQPIPVIPTRVLDTRNAAGRTRLVNVPAGTLDSTGRIIGGKSVTLSLADLIGSDGGVFANVVSTGSTAGGFLQIYPADPRPGASTVNFAAGQTIANFSFTSIDTTAFTVKIFASVTSHVIVDVTAFATGSPAFINLDILPSTARTTAASRAARAAHLERVRPDWVKRQMKAAGLR